MKIIVIPFILIFFNIFETIIALQPPLAVTVFDGKIMLARPEHHIGPTYIVQPGESLACFCPSNNPYDPLVFTVFENDKENHPSTSNAEDSSVHENNRNESRCNGRCEHDFTPHFDIMESFECGDHGYYISIGYRVSLINISHSEYFTSPSSGITKQNQTKSTRFLRIINLCYNHNQKTVQFMKHKLRAADFIDPENQSDNFQYPYSEEYYPYYHPEEFYDHNNQEKSFKKIFHDKFEIYFTPENHERRKFIKQQVVESGDMPIPIWKIITHNYLTTAPMWISVKHGSWKKVSRYIKKFASRYEIEFTVYSGTYGVLKIDDYDVYLYNSKQSSSIPVPLIFWKFLYHPITRLGIFIAIYNDIDNSTTDDSFCKVIDCFLVSGKGWGYEDIKQGIAICCELNDDLKKKLNLYDLLNIEVKPFNRVEKYLDSIFYEQTKKVQNSYEDEFNIESLPVKSSTGEDDKPMTTSDKKLL